MDKLSRMIEFSNAQFPFAKEDEELCNHDSMHGYMLAKHIAAGLKPKGLSVSCFIGEDWGWLCEIDHEGDFPLWYGVASFERSDEFIIQFEPEKGAIRKLFRKVDVSGPLTQLQEGIFSVLQQTEGNISGPEWVPA